MAIKLKAKSYGPIYVIANQHGELRYSEDLEAETSASPDISSPAISLLYSLGSCIAISLAMVAQREKIQLADFYLMLSADKASDLPNRFGSFTVAVSATMLADKNKAHDLIKKAKSICTVSNTLNANIKINLIE